MHVPKRYFTRSLSIYGITSDILVSILYDKKNAKSRKENGRLTKTCLTKTGCLTTHVYGIYLILYYHSNELVWINIPLLDLQAWVKGKNWPIEAMDYVLMANNITA